MDYGHRFGDNDQIFEIEWQDNDEMDFPEPENYSHGYDEYSYNRNNQGGFRREMYGPPRRGPGPPGPYMWGRGFGPAGPPVQHGNSRDNPHLRYLIRCGVPKEHLKGLPNVLLRLMEPEYCGVCAHNLENYTMSRLHYMSKNHMKNQKKWLSQQAEAGAQRPKEMPMKSRELYCELCDVQITSKTHAESHYAGRPHRAIVEGRKKPKNPYLLQRGMQERVKQLIRREKKNLKPAEAVESEVAAEKEAKPIPPELYCEICKTSVTCTEQMTMHLNGKKHLSKEKQHILKMMKVGSGAVATESNQKVGEVDATAERVGEGDNATAVATEEGQQEKEKNQTYDWGNGSGTWDDDLM